MPHPHNGRLTLHFEQRRELEEHFEPLRLPGLRSADAAGLDGNQIDALRSELRVSLRAGDHRLPVNRRQPLLLRISEGTTCQISLRTGRADEPSLARAIVADASVRFDPPVMLHDIAPTLLGLQELFADRDALAVRRVAAEVWASQPAAKLQGAALRRLERLEHGLQKLAPFGLPIGERVAGTREAIARGLKRLDGETRRQLSALRDAVEGGSPRLPVVHLERITARPVRRRQGWRLALRFTGRWGYDGVCMFGFEELGLPAIVLPAPHALLEGLLSAQPLESAVVDAERWPIEAIAQALAGAVRELEVAMDADLRLPALGLSLPMSDRGVLEAEVRLREPVRVRTTARVVVEADRISGRVEQLRVEGGQGQADVQGSFALGRGPDGDLGGGDGDDGDRDDSGDANGGTRSRLSEAEGDGPRAEEQILAVLTEALMKRRWPTDDLALRASLEVAEGSRLPTAGVVARLHHPLAHGGVDLELDLANLDLDGRLSVRARPGTVVPEDVDLRFSADARTAEGTCFADGVLLLHPALRVEDARGTLRSDGEGGLALRLTARGGVELCGTARIEAFPELSIDEGELDLRARGTFDIDASARTGAPDRPPVTGDFGGTRASLAVQEATVSLGERRLTLPADSALHVGLDEGVLATTGLGRARISLAWDLKGRSPVLRAPGQEVAIFAPELRQGAFDIHISQVGGLRVTGVDRGLYDFRLFNALINPGAELDRWVELLGDDDAVERILATVRVFSPEAAELLAEARRFARRLSRVLEAEGIEGPGDFLPAATIARVLSRVLADSLEPEERIRTLVMRVVNGEGLDVPAVKRLLDTYLPEHERAFEIDRGLRILARALTPTEPVPALEPERVTPLCERPALASRFRGLPPAGQLYRTVLDPAPLPAGFSAMAARIAPYLSADQLAFLLDSDRDDWRPEDRARLRAIHHLKERIALIAEEYGGAAFLPQAWAIGFFIGQATHPALELDPGPWPAHEDGERYPLATSLLGPAEVATLLHAGLAAVWQGSPVQINQRLLIDLMLRQPPTFVREVLVEMSGRSAQALTGALYGLLDIEQQRMREPIDVPGRFAEALGLPIPKLKDYMAGGRWARQSHYEALFKVAEHILAESKPYRALREHLQVRRMPPPPPLTLAPPRGGAAGSGHGRDRAGRRAVGALHLPGP